MPDRVQVDGGPGQQVVGKVSQGYESGFGEVVQHEEEKEKPKDVVELIMGRWKVIRKVCCSLKDMV